MGRGNPRETRMVLKRVYDFALVLQNGVITNDLTKKALGLMEATGLKKRQIERLLELCKLNERLLDKVNDC